MSRDDFVVVLDYGMGNIHSIVKALRLYLPDVRYSNNIHEIKEAKALVLPGDGAFPAAMEGLTESLRGALLHFLGLGRPLLGICIGFQILFTDSEEKLFSSTPITKGLDLLKGRIRKFSFADGIPVPHMGWNRLIPVQAAVRGEYMYFIHSYRAVDVPEKFVEAYCEYAGERFPAIVRKDNIRACQFHPEKSGESGLRLLKEWVASIS